MSRKIGCDLVKTSSKYGGREAEGREIFQTGLLKLLERMRFHLWLGH